MPTTHADVPRYDAIGRAYARHRRAEPRLAAQIERALGDARRIVDVGAGTGSYEPPERDVVAVEPSPVMIAQRTAGAAPVVRGVAERLPFADGTFDAALAVFTVHHWSDVAVGLHELGRVAPRIVVLTFDPDVHARFWLFTDYLPEATALASHRVAPPEVIAEWIGATRVEVVRVPADCADGFNWAYWNRPAAYIDPEVRACISGLALLPAGLVARRMERLRDDLADGSWDARHGHLREMAEVDGGLRLVVRE